MALIYEHDLIILTSSSAIYRREIALQDGQVLAKSGRLERGENILRTL